MKTKKLLVIVMLFAFTFSVVGKVSAENNETTNANNGLPEGFVVPTGNVSSAVFGGGEYVPVIKVKIGEVSFDEASRKLNIETTIINESSNFLDNLEYAVDLRKGDKLNDNGYLFAGVAHVYEENGSLQKIAPKKTLKKTISITVPKNIETGNYFLQLFVNDKNMKFQDVDYTRQFFQLTGEGGAISNLKAYFIIADEIFSPMAGPAVTLEDVPMVAIPLDRNEEIENYLKSGKKLKAKVEVVSTTGNREIAKTFTEDLQQKEIKGKDSLFFQLRIGDNDTALKQGGSFDVKVKLIGENDEELADGLLRWMIDFGQVMGRIMGLETDKNVYKQGEEIKVATELELYNTENKTAILELTLKGSNNFSQTIIKEMELKGETTVDVSFSDQKISKDTKLTDVNLILKDKETGIIIDKYEMDIDFPEAYGASFVVSETPEKTIDGNFGIVRVIAYIIAGMVFISTILVIFFRKRK